MQEPRKGLFASGGVLSDSNSDKLAITEAFDHALAAYKAAGAALRESVATMHKIGIYPPPPEGVRFRLSDERKGMTHKMVIGDKKPIKGCVTSGTYSDGSLGEVFLEAEKMGTFESGILDAFATMFSIALQYGVPLDRLITKFRHTRFEPSGFTKSSEIRSAKSIIDYLMQWLELRYVNKGETDERQQG